MVFLVFIELKNRSGSNKRTEPSEILKAELFVKIVNG